MDALSKTARELLREPRVRDAVKDAAKNSSSTTVNTRQGTFIVGKTQSPEKPAQPTPTTGVIAKRVMELAMCDKCKHANKLHLATKTGTWYCLTCQAECDVHRRANG